MKRILVLLICLGILLILLLSFIFVSWFSDFFGKEACSDGTAYLECSNTKPKYCDDGVLVNKCSVCGCDSNYECQSDGSCERAEKKGRGIVLIHKDSEAVGYAEQLADERGWTYLAVEKDPIKIRNEIIKYAKDDDYLLIIGSKETIPITWREVSDMLLGGEEVETCEDGTPVGYCNDERTQRCLYSPLLRGENDVTLISGCPDDWLSASEGGKELVLDSTYYGNIDNDPFVELNVGRVPFDEEDIVENYFGNFLGGKGINFAEYPLQKEFADEKVQLLKIELTKTIIDDLEAYDKPSKDMLIDIIEESKIFGITTHGGATSYSLPGIGSSFTIEDVPDLSNHPIVIALSCTTARLLGQEFIKKGAKGYIGAYFEGGPNKFNLLKHLTTGKTIGESFKDYRNRLIVRGISYQALGSFRREPGTKVLNEEVGDLGIFGEKITILYGDPLIQIDISGDIQEIQTSMTDNQLTFELSEPLVDRSEEIGMVGVYREIGAEYLGTPPEEIEISLPKNSEIIIPVSGINSISDVTATDEDGDELEVHFAVLVKGNTEQFLFISQEALELKTTTMINFG